jgi:hypothetical protein
MKHLGVLTLICLTAMCVASAVVAPSASALALWHLCFLGHPEKIELCPKNYGPVTEEPFKKVPFGGSGEAAELVSSEGTIKCVSDEIEGETEGSNQIVKTVMIFRGCKDSFGKECKTGTESEVIKTKTLSGELVDLEKAEKRLGALFKPTTGTEVTLEIKCSVNVKVTGEVIGEISPENSFGEKKELIFNVIGGTQKWRQIEEAGAFHELSAFGGKAALGGVQVLTFSKALGAMA